MTCYTEFDEMQEALKKVRINEDVCPLRYGMLVKEGADTYGKMQKLLACNEMENCHKFIYDLDPENLEDQDIDKINQLFDLGVKKGYIDNSFEEEFQKEQNPDAYVPAEEKAPVQQSTCCVNDPNSCWTILYSATKNGETKCGECFSNSTSVGAAKADCMAKLAKFGYENISILAIEAGDPDCCGCNENDILKNRPHNAHVSVDEADDSENADGADSELDEAGNPYAAGMKVVTGNNISSAKKTAKKKCVKEDDDEGSEDEGSEDEGSEDEGSEDEGSEDEGSEDEGSDEGSEDEGSDEGSEDEGSDEGSEDEGSDEGSEDEGSDEGSDDDKKAQYKNEYKQVFKDVMLKCKFEDKCFNDLTIEQKVTFFETLNDKWNKAEPNKFMTPKEEEQLNAVVVSNS